MSREECCILALLMFLGICRQVFTHLVSCFVTDVGIYDVVTFDSRGNPGQSFVFVVPSEGSIHSKHKLLNTIILYVKQRIMEQRRISEGSIQEPFLRVLSMLHIVNSHYFQSTSKKLLAEYVNDEINP
jgi:predicted XRE-type DNA-binding protein